MADETTMAEVTDAVTADAATPAPKKQRAPRRAKATAEVAVAAQPPKTGKVVKERKKRALKAQQPAASVTEKPATGSVRKGRAPVAKPTKAAIAHAPASAADAMAELLQLEEENKRLRQSLAEKLRAENADLRKRLGLA